MKANQKIATTNQQKTERKHCADCCHYVNGIKEARMDGSIIFHKFAGMQFHRKTIGPIYHKIGTNTSCHCTAGNKVWHGYRQRPSGEYDVNEPFEGFFSDNFKTNKNIERIKQTEYQSEVAEIMKPIVNKTKM